MAVTLERNGRLRTAGRGAGLCLTVTDLSSTLINCRLTIITTTTDQHASNILNKPEAVMVSRTVANLCRPKL